MSRRCLGIAAALLVGSAVTLLGISPASALRTAGWATWTPITGSSNNYATTMQLPALGFPKATVASDSRGNVQLPSGATTFLGGATDSVPTDVGVKYGSSRNQSYLNLRPKADNANSPSTTTYTFDHPTPDTGWAFVLGDIDADKVQISAKDAAGNPLTPAQINGWKAGHDAFNYAGDADIPTWDANTATLTGNAAAADTDGAAAWFEPDVSISSLTFVFTWRAGFPVYQTWFASVARTISGTVTDASISPASCSVQDATIHLAGPDGQALASTQPSSDGSYSFGQYATQDGYTVSIDWPATCVVVGSQQQSVTTAASDATADFTLRAIIPQPVSGRVTRLNDGAPVAGAQITLTPPGGGTPKITTTDSEGNYLFDDNAVGDGYTVEITGVPDGYTVNDATQFPFDVADTPITGLDFALVEQPDVTGTITGGGDPLGGVTVTLTPSGGGTAVTTTTLGDGTYSFAHIPAGSYDISVTAPDGYDAVPARTDVAVASTDVTGQDFALGRPGSLGGQVTDTSAAANPITGATVTVAGPGGTQTLQTDADGSYFLGDLDPGAYVITLTVPEGYAASGVITRTVTITDEGEIRGGQDFLVTPAFPVTGSVTAGGDPVADSEITIRTPDQTVVDTVKTSDDGTYATPGLPAAAGYTATVSPPSGYTVAGSATVSFTVTDRAVAGIDFTLTKSSTPPTGPSGPSDGGTGPQTTNPPADGGASPPTTTSLANTGVPVSGELRYALGILGVGALVLLLAGRSGPHLPRLESVREP